MNPEEAKEILMVYRPDTADIEDPRVREAMETARRDSDLAQWLEEHIAFQRAMRSKFREINVPEHLKPEILAHQNILRPVFWQRTTVWWAAAAIVFLMVGLWIAWPKPHIPDRFTNFRERMVSKALREYQMDIMTNDMRALRQAIQARGAPADYELSSGLQKLLLSGGAALTWRSHPVSMVCFDRGDKAMVFLFVMKRNAVKDPPPELSPAVGLPKVTSLSQMLTVSWSKGDNAYLLLGSVEPDFPAKYIN